MHATKVIQHAWHWWNGKDIEARFEGVRRVWERLANEALEERSKPPKRLRIHIDAGEYVSPFEGNGKR